MPEEDIVCSDAVSSTLEEALSQFDLRRTIRRRLRSSRAPRQMSTDV